MSHSPALLCLAGLCGPAAFLLADRTERVLLTNTAVLALAVEVVVLPIAAVLAFLLARTNLRWKSPALLLCSSLLFVPLYLQLAGWEAAFGRQGWHTYLFNTLQDPWLSGWRGTVFVHSVYAIPWATMIMAAAFTGGGREEEEMALLDGTGDQVFRLVTLRQLAGGLFIAAAWIFVITAGEMTVTNIYLVPTYAEDVYNFYAGNPNALDSAVHLLPLLLFVAALVLVLAAVLRPSTPLPSPAPFLWQLHPFRGAISIAVLLLLLVLTIFPIANLIERTGPRVVQVDGQLVRTWSMAKAAEMIVVMPYKLRHEFSNTALIAMWVAGISVSVGCWLAWIARTSPALSTCGWTAAAVGLALPGPVVGLLVLTLLSEHTPWLYDLRDTLWASILALLIRVLPLAFIALWWTMRTLDPEPLEAARLDGTTSFRTGWSIALPQRWPLVFAMGIATFVIASGDVSTSLLLIPPGPNETVARRLFGLIHVGADDQVAAVALVCWAGYVVTAVVALRLFISLTHCKVLEN